MNLLYDFNHTRPTEQEKQEALLKELFAESGEGCFIEPPLHANWDGHHVHMGKNVHANFNLTMVDDTHIYIGDYTMIGPNVVIATGGHLYRSTKSLLVFLARYSSLSARDARASQSSRLCTVPTA